MAWLCKSSVYEISSMPEAIYNNIASLKAIVSSQIDDVDINPLFLRAFQNGRKNDNGLAQNS
jgi:hypothetical protein